MPFTIQKRDEMTKDISLATSADLSQVANAAYYSKVHLYYGDNTNLSSCSNWTPCSDYVDIVGVCLSYPPNYSYLADGSTKLYILNFSLRCDLCEDRWFRLLNLPGYIISAQATTISTGDLRYTTSRFVVSYSGKDTTLYIGQDENKDRVAGVSVQVVCIA